MVENKSLITVRERERESSNLKNKKGITLIALVITIIVLLILAGVTVATLTGDNGLLKKTTTSKEKTEESNELELIKLAVSSAQLEGEGIVTTDNLNNELKKTFNNDKEVIESSECWYYRTSRIYKIDKNGLVEIVSLEINILANIKTIELQRIILELEVNSNSIIDYININDLSGNMLKFDDINKEKYKIEIETQVTNEHNIMICSGENYYVAKLQVESTYLGGEYVTVNEPNEKYYGFGAKGRYYYKKLSSNPTISLGTFGDPYPGVQKFSYSIGDKVMIYDQKLLNDNKDYMKEMTNNVLDISEYKEGTFYISMEGYGIESIESAKLYKNGTIVSSANINNNKFLIDAAIRDGEKYNLEIIYSDNHKYNRSIRIKKKDNIEEQLLGGENMRLNTEGKWYYIKFGVDQRWKYKWFFGDNITISNATMGGDPASGYPKNTYLVDIAEIEDIITME